MNTAPTELETLVRARYPILQIASYEEDRVEQALSEVATRRGKNLVCWSVTRGLYGHGESLAKSKRSFSASTVSRSDRSTAFTAGNISTTFRIAVSPVTRSSTLSSR